MADSCFIDDGQNVPRFIRGVPGMYPDVMLEVRPMLPTDQSHWHAALARLGNEDERTDYTTKILSERIVTWSVDRPQSPENLKKVWPGLYDRLFAIVWGRDAGDPLPATGRHPEHNPEAAAGN